MQPPVHVEDLLDADEKHKRRRVCVCAREQASVCVCGCVCVHICWYACVCMWSHGYVHVRNNSIFFTCGDHT